MYDNESSELATLWITSGVKLWESPTGVEALISLPGWIARVVKV